MKGLIGIFLVIVGVITSVSAGVWYGWWYPKEYEYALQLANDASLPKAKADYLEEYLNLVSGINGEPRYFFMRKDLKLETQREILRGLVKRFRDIENISPSEMAYQQGMMQLTGQEMDNQIDKISGIFCSAKVRENPLIFFIFAFLSWPLLVVGIILSNAWAFEQ